MKKSISVLLVLAMVFALAACVSVKVAETPFEKNKGTEAVATEEPTAAPTAEPTAVPTAEPTPEPTKALTPEPTPAPTEAPTPEPEPTEVPFATIAAAANEKLRQVQSFRMDMDLTVDMEMALVLGEIRQSIPVDVDMTLTMNVIQDPLLIQAHMTVSALGQTTSSLIYGAKDGEHTVIYTSLNNGATWQKRTDPEGDGMLTAPVEAMDLLGDSVDMALAGTEDVNGRPAAVYVGKLDGQHLQEIFESTIALEGMSEALAVDLPEGALADRQDMDVKVMIDEESGLPVRYRVDMTAALQYFLTAALQEGMEDAEMQLNMSTAWLEGTLADFDAVSPFAIPEAALNAPEA